MNTYHFDIKKITQEILDDMKHYFEYFCKCDKALIAISGGKDSTIVAKLAVEAFGKDNVYGIMLPNGFQNDLQDSKNIIKYLGIHGLYLNINTCYNSLIKDFRYCNDICITNQAFINLAPRLRMSVTYFAAQCVNAIVLNTSNLTEDILGYCTLWGDTCGSYAPIQGLTVTEVLQIGDYLGLPKEFVHKTPSDGLTGKSDEEKLGLKYSEVDDIIRTGTIKDCINKEYIQQVTDKIKKYYYNNKFKIQMIDLPGLKFEYLPNYIKGNNT